MKVGTLEPRKNLLGLIAAYSRLPVLLEGFGLPPLEAMTRGLERLLTDDAFRENAAAAGPRRAAQFTWERCVDRTVGVYRQVLSAASR